MAKTNFSLGTVVTSAFMDSIFYSPHKHDDGTDDGHAEKITLTDGEEVDGLLSHNNMENILYRNYMYMPIYAAFTVDTINIPSLVVSMAKAGAVVYDKDSTIIMDFRSYLNSGNNITIIDSGVFKHIADGGIVKDGLTFSTQTYLELYAIYDPTPSTGYKGLFVCESITDAFTKATAAGYVRRIGYIPLYDDSGPNIIQFEKRANKIFVKPVSPYTNNLVVSNATYPATTWPQNITINTVPADIVGLKIDCAIDAGGYFQVNEYTAYRITEEKLSDNIDVSLRGDNSVSFTGATGKNVIAAMYLLYWIDDGDFQYWDE